MPRNANCARHRHTTSKLLQWTLLAASLWCGIPAVASAQTAQWIWSGERNANNRLPATVYFRKSFEVNQPERGQVVMAADDQYELYVNGRRVAEGTGWREPATHDITQYLTRGFNVLAVKVSNTAGTTAGLAARVVVKEVGGTAVSHSSDASWKTHTSPFTFWQSPRYSDRRWAQGHVYGPMGTTAPWIVPPKEPLANAGNPNAGGLQTDEQGRFSADSEFEVQLVISPEDAKSLIAMTFNEFGDLVASRENGPLILITDTNNDKVPDKTRIYCDEVKNCQGLLALNGDLFVTGEGPDGVALYRLSDKDRDGKLEILSTVLKFKGEASEHGPHGLTLGPDGYLYVMVGNHSAADLDYAETSPHRNIYEGDLVGPRFEDSGGHAAGVKAPGGLILRTNLKGTNVELFAGGFRNAYDLAFNRFGDLWTHDSDMESDAGSTWYRPTRVNHVIPGSEFGWRSGWAKWPEYFNDSLPAVIETGRGSPTGMVVYDHFMFPQRYHDALFLCDWAQGRILALKLKPDGAGYEAQAETFVEGQPLNVVDIEVGPEGALYFATGGRDTAGGIYRVIWKGKIPESVSNLGAGVTAAVRHPQLQSAWARQKLALLKRETGEDWPKLLPAVAKTTRNPARFRTRALDLMQLFGPTPNAALLLELSRDDNAEVRAKVVELMGLMEDSEVTQRLISLLDDDDPRVRRKACEALARNGGHPSVEQLSRMLRSNDRYEAWAARRLLETIPERQWRPQILTAADQRLFIEGATALMIAHPTKENGIAVAERAQQLMRGFVTDRNFTDMLRVLQIALHRAELTAADVPKLGPELALEFPSKDAIMNRELIRLLTYLQETSIIDRSLERLNSDQPETEKLHLALHLGLIKQGWNGEQKMSLLRYYEHAFNIDGGNSLPGYVQRVSRAFAENLTAEEAETLLADGSKMPGSALMAIFKLPKNPSPEVLQRIRHLDMEIADKHGNAVDRLKIGVVAVLARSGDAESLAYLREIYDRDPERRPSVAVGLAQSPGGDNWEYLIRSLPVLEGSAAQTVMISLRNVQTAPEEPEAYRQAVIAGLKLGDKGGQHAADLLYFWTGQSPDEGKEKTADRLAAWQTWYAEKFPDRPEAVLAVDSDRSKWSLEQLLKHLESDEGSQGNAVAGRDAFIKGQCIKCHRHGTIGESMGPDLTSIARRFRKKEMLESILYPSHVISDQYLARNIITADGRSLSGIVSPGGPGEIVVLQANGQKTTILESEIDESIVSKTSAMPEGLLNDLTLQEISDLFAFLFGPAETNVTVRPATPPKR